MNIDARDLNGSEAVARQVAQDLRSIGSVTYEPRLTGHAVLEDGVMFALVDSDGTLYLRASAQSAVRFHDLGGTKHAEMPYWSVPGRARSNIAMLRELAYEAADIAHIAASFGIDDLSASEPTIILRPTFRALATVFTLTAA